MEAWEIILLIIFLAALVVGVILVIVFVRRSDEKNNSQAAGVPLRPGGSTTTDPILNFLIADNPSFDGATGLLSMNSSGVVSFDTSKTVNADSTWNYGPFKGNDNVLYNGNNLALTVEILSQASSPGSVPTFKGVSDPVATSSGEPRAFPPAGNTYTAEVSKSWVYTNNDNVYSQANVWLVDNPQHLPVEGVTIELKDNDVQGAYVAFLGSKFYNLNASTRQQISVGTICVPEQRGSRPVVC